MASQDSLTGQLLIAMPAMNDPNFARGVVLICRHGQDGAFGVLVNRPADIVLGNVLTQMEIETDDAALTGRPVLTGGPVDPHHGFVLHGDDSDWAATLQVRPGLALTSSRDILEAMAAGSGPERSLIALGYAGWQGGQLETELLENAWLTVPADSDLLFDVPVERRWQAAAERLGVDLGRLADYAGHA